MGRLDDAAKRKVVELREAGLSFRKIKAVLELENIKVSAQAIYLFLKEFQGRTGREDGTTGNSAHTIPGGTGEPRPVGWSDQQLRNLLREASRVAASQQATSSSDIRPAGTSSAMAGRRETQESEKDEDIRIVSVTTLAQGTQHTGIQVPRIGGGTGAMGGGNALARRRHTPSPANPVLVARRRLLDKALLHRARVREGGAQTSQQVPLSVRRDQSCFSGPDGRKVMLPQTASYDLTRPTNMRTQGPVPLRRWTQRTSTPVRTLQHPPRLGVRPPDPQNAVASTRVQNVTGQPSPPPPPPPQRNVLDPAAVSGLQEQIQSLSSELRNLGVALRMMAEQQGRLEREQAQQTQVQKQILSTLQQVASRLEPSAPASCSMANSEPFGQATPTQGIYAQCSQAQTRYNEIHDSGLEGIEAFSLDQLAPPTINGFQQCPTSGVASFTHAQTRAPTFTQTFTHSPYADSYGGMNNKSVDMTSSGADGTFQACSPPNQSTSLPVSPHETELNIIKVENV